MDALHIPKLLLSNTQYTLRSKAVASMICIRHNTSLQDIAELLGVSKRLCVMVNQDKVLLELAAPVSSNFLKVPIMWCQRMSVEKAIILALITEYKVNLGQVFLRESSIGLLLGVSERHVKRHKTFLHRNGMLTWVKKAVPKSRFRTCFYEPLGAKMSLSAVQKCPVVAENRCKNVLRARLNTLKDEQPIGNFVSDQKASPIGVERLPEIAGGAMKLKEIHDGYSKKEKAQIDLGILEGTTSPLKQRRYWQACMSANGYTLALDLSTKERACLKSLGKMLTEVSVTDFMKFVIVNWDRIRNRLGKKRLAATPSFLDAYFIRNDIMSLIGEWDTESFPDTTKAVEDQIVTITKKEDLPVGHPAYYSLAKELERMGKVRLHKSQLEVKQ